MSWRKTRGSDCLQSLRDGSLCPHDFARGRPKGLRSRDDLRIEFHSVTYGLTVGLYFPYLFLNVFQVFSLGVEMSPLSTYIFLVLRLINVLLEVCKNEDELVETSSYKKYFRKFGPGIIFFV